MLPKSTFLPAKTSSRCGNLDPGRLRLVLASRSKRAYKDLHGFVAVYWQSLRISLSDILVQRWTKEPVTVSTELLLVPKAMLYSFLHI